MRDRIYEGGMGAGTGIDDIVTKFLEEHAVQDLFNKNYNPLALRAAAAAKANCQTAEERIQWWRAQRADLLGITLRPNAITLKTGPQTFRDKRELFKYMRATRGMGRFMCKNWYRNYGK
eukprot:5332180-Karenia_brevis.AAC.1